MVNAVTSLAETPLELYSVSLGSWKRIPNESFTEKASSADTDGPVSSTKNTGKKREAEIMLGLLRMRKRFHQYIISTTIIRSQFQFSLVTFSKFKS